MKRACCFLLGALFISGVAGCSATLVVSSPSPSLPTASIPAITATPSATPSNSISTPIPTIPENTWVTETEPPEPTPEPPPKPGVWVPDTYYGVNGEHFEYGQDGKGHIVKNSDYEWVLAVEPAADPDIDEIEEAKKVSVKAGGWEYYFDTANPVIYDGSEYGYPILRKNSTGNVENLGIDGFVIVAAPQYIYVLNNWSFGDFAHWDTWRVSLDGKEKRYVGDALEPFVPAQDKYLYFSGFDGYIYRTDLAFTAVEKIFPDTPDIGKIEQAVEPSLIKIMFETVKDDWLYFRIFAYNTDDGRDYDGGYRMLLNGGKVYKTDEGAYGEAISFGDEDIGE